MRKLNLKLYSYEFNGIWPVGAVAIAIAETKEQAAVFLKDEIDAAVAPDTREIVMDDIVEIPMYMGAHVLLNGNY